MDKDVGNPEQGPKGSSRGGLRLLQLAAFFSSFDRFAVAPMLLTIAASLGTSLAGVAATASLYYLLYGGMQPGRHGEKIASRGGKNARKRAVVAVARKLSVLLHRLWISGEVYEALRNARGPGGQGEEVA